MATKEYDNGKEIGKMQVTDDNWIMFRTNGQWIDIRIWVENERYQGPTRKGIRFPAEEITKFRKMVKRMDKILDNWGTKLEKEKND